MSTARREPADLSFDDWVGARVPALLRFAFLVTGSQHDAEEAVQAALTQACAKWSRIGRADDADAYVRRMVVNAHVSRWRRAGRREMPVAQVNDASVIDVAEGVSTSAAVWQVCSTLPRQQRAAVVLRFYEDLDYDEIAAVLGVSQVTVRGYVHRALASLRVLLAEPIDVRDVTEEGADGRR